MWREQPWWRRTVLSLAGGVELQDMCCLRRARRGGWVESRCPFITPWVAGGVSCPTPTAEGRLQEVIVGAFPVSDSCRQPKNDLVPGLSRSSFNCRGRHGPGLGAEVGAAARIGPKKMEKFGPRIAHRRNTPEVQPRPATGEAASATHRPPLCLRARRLHLRSPSALRPSRGPASGAACCRCASGVPACGVRPQPGRPGPMRCG